MIGVAVRADGRNWVRSERVSRGAETLLVPWALELCAEAGFPLRELEGIACANGPGAFTGIRVGMAAAAGLAIGLKVPFWVGSSLTARSNRIGVGRVLSMLDAKKSRVYAEYRVDGVLVHGPEDIAPDLAIRWCESPFLATGEGATVYASQVNAAGGQVAGEADHPAVDQLAVHAEQAFLRGESTSPLQLEPVYLRGADAIPPPR